jgi:hypothetical protein
MHAGDFERIARTADELKFDSLGRAPVLRGKQATIDAIAELQEIGVTWTSIPPPPTRSLTEYLESLQWAAEEIMPAFR